jgi:rhodanese-related sulfurtransferase
LAKKLTPSKSTRSGSAHRRQRTVRKPNLTWLWVGLAVFIIAAAVYLLWPKNQLQTEITATQAYQKYQQGAFILDVRSQEEWDQVHIASSTLIPRDDLQNRLSELPRNRDIVVVCLSGHRSKEGMTLLQQAGFSRASCMTGG